MIAHQKTLFDLIKEEDNLIRQIEITDDQIVNNLYTSEESPDKEVRQKAEDAVDLLRERKGRLLKELKDIRTELKRKILKLYEE